MSDTAMPEPARARPGPGGARGAVPATGTAQVTTTATVHIPELARRRALAPSASDDNAGSRGG